MSPARLGSLYRLVLGSARWMGDSRVCSWRPRGHMGPVGTQVSLDWGTQRASQQRALCLRVPRPQNRLIPSSRSCCEHGAAPLHPDVHIVGPSPGFKSLPPPQSWKEHWQLDLLPPLTDEESMTQRSPGSHLRQSWDPIYLLGPLSPGSLCSSAIHLLPPGPATGVGEPTARPLLSWSMRPAGRVNPKPG